MTPKPEFKSPRLSQTTITELMIPSYANFGGKIHGGTILSMMDKVAYACASKHAGTYCVTASIDEVNFLQPVEVGDLLSLKAMVNYVGRTSLVIGIRVESENIKTNIIKHTNTSYFTMVARNDDHSPAIVPGLLLESPDDVRRFIEAYRRKQLNTEFLKEQEKLKAPIVMADVNELLQHERCRIDF